MTGKDFSIEEMEETMDGASLSDAPSDGYEIGLIDVLTQPAYRKWLIARVTGIAMLIGVFLCFVLPVRYTAITKLMPPPKNSFCGFHDDESTSCAVPKSDSAIRRSNPA